MTARDFDQLAAAVLEGTATPEQYAALEAELDANPASFDRFVRLSEVHATLGWELQYSRLSNTEPTTRIKEPSAPHSPRTRAAVQAKLKLGAAWSLAAALLLSAATIAVYRFAFSADPKPPIADPSSHPIATLIDATGDVIVNDSPASPGVDYKPGAYTTLAGTAELLLTSRVSIEMQSETDLSIHGPMRSALTRGAASFHCPAGAEGYTVGLPYGARVIDLGTRFRVSLEENHSPRVDVYEGAVEFVTADGLSIGLVPGAPLRLVDDGTIAWIDSEDIEITNASFEHVVAETGNFRHGATGWESLGGDDQYGVNRFGGQFSDPVPDGDQLAFVNSGGIAQTLDTRLTPNRRYTLSVYIGNRSGPNSPDYTLELWAGDRMLASAANPTMPEKGRFVLAELVFDCPPGHPAAGEQIRIVLRSNGSLETQTQNHFDKVRLRVETDVHREPIEKSHPIKETSDETSE